MSDANASRPPAPIRRPVRVEHVEHKGFAPLRWIAAAPALLALTTSVALAAMIATRGPAEVLPWYRGLAERAIADHDYQLSTVCYQRLLADEPDDPANELGLAVSLAGVGRQREAAELFARLTPPDQPGYVPARLLIAQQLLSYPSRTPAMVDRAEQNLLRAVDSEPTNETAHALLATIYAVQEKWEMCKYHLERSGVLRPALEARLLATHARPGTQPK